jgi:hypothetical protein
MTTNTRPELTPVLDRFQNPKYADAGATQQGGPIPMKKCSACQGHVVWVKSTKTGKFYLADCFRYSGGESYFYVKASPHFKTCEERVASQERLRQEELQKADETKRWEVARAELMACSERWKGNGSDPGYEAEWNGILVRNGFEHMAILDDE